MIVDRLDIFPLDALEDFGQEARILPRHVLIGRRRFIRPAAGRQPQGEADRYGQYQDRDFPRFRIHRPESIRAVATRRQPGRSPLKEFA
jgi:hypothetical protein